SRSDRLPVGEGTYLASRMSGIRTFWLKTLGVFALLGGTVALYFGFGTFFVPAAPREGFFVKERVPYAILPLTVGVVTLCLAGWLFFRSVPNPRRQLSGVITFCIGGAIGAIWLFFIVGAIYQSSKGF